MNGLLELKEAPAKSWKEKKNLSYTTTEINSTNRPKEFRSEFFLNCFQMRTWLGLPLDCSLVRF